MVDFEYLYRGLCGMANSPKASSMAGHLGAAVVAGYFIGEDHADLPDGVVAGIERDLDRITGGEESIWFNPKKAGITASELFQALPEEKARPESIESIADALANNVSKARQSGHNVIFASIALRALKEHPDHATPKLVSGIEKLIRAFDNQHPGRGYYGKSVGWKSGNQAPLADAESTPVYKSLNDMAEVMIDQMIATASERRQGFGGLFHLTNHAAALTELDRLGFEALARKGLAAHRQHLRLYRALPILTEELGELEHTAEDPFQPAYWKRTKSKQWGAWLTHRIKTLYGFHTLLRFVEDEKKREAAKDQFGYLLA
jgi:hypothetical protein